MEEIWAKIPGFPNHEISNTGKIFRIGKTKRIPIKVCKDGNYIYASLNCGFHQSKQVNVKQMMNKCFTEHIYSDHSIDDLPGEVWKDVVGWEEAYEVSNLGRIKSKERMRSGKNGSESYVYAKIKEGYLDEDGYLRISLYFNNTNKLVGVHRIVAEAFVPNPDTLPQVNHMNGDKSDNRAENLEWVTNTQNIRHSIEHKLRDPNIASIPIIRLEDEMIFPSIAELHRYIGGSYNGIVHLFKESNGEKVLIDGKWYKYYKGNK